MPYISTDLGPIYVDDQGEANSPVALLWPSLFTDHTMWRNQVPLLRQAGWRTITFDPPGHGKSIGPGRRFTMDECAAAVLHILEELEIRTPFVFFGTSWGGMVGPRVALRAPDRVRAMVLFNTSAQRALPGQLSKATVLLTLMYFKAADKIVDGLILASMLASETRLGKPAIGDDLLSKLHKWDRRRRNLTVRSVLIDRKGILQLLPQVAAPTLIVSGQEDITLPTVLSLNMAAKLPHAYHVEVPGAAHLSPLEAPEATNQLIHDFLADLT